MRKCPECDAEVTTYDRKCPSCTYPLVTEQDVAASAASRPRLQTSAYKWWLFCLKFGQVIAILGIAASFLYPILLLAMRQFFLLMLSPIGIILAFAQYYVFAVCIEYTEEKVRGKRHG